MTLATFLTGRIHAWKITQKQLATLVGISEQYLGDILHGHRKPTDAHLLRKFADGLLVHPDVLYFHAGLLAPDMAAIQADDQAICSAYAALRRILKDEGAS